MTTSEIRGIRSEAQSGVSGASIDDAPNCRLSQPGTFTAMAS